MEMEPESRVDEMKEDVFSDREVKMDICGGQMMEKSDFIRSEDCENNLFPEHSNLSKDVQSNEQSVKTEPIEVKQNLIDALMIESAAVSVSSKEVEPFSLSTNNLSLIRGKQLLNGNSEETLKVVKDDKLEQIEEAPVKDDPIREDQMKEKQIKEAPVKQDLIKTVQIKEDQIKVENDEAKLSEISSKLINGHHHEKSSSSHIKKDDKSDHSKHRDRDRHRPKRANIGIQCRRDKNLEKTVGFSVTNVESPLSGSGSSQPDARSGSEFVCSPRFAGYSMANPCYNLGSKYRFGSLMRVETYPNGGGKVLHLWQDEFSHFSELDQEELAKDFIMVKLKVDFLVIFFG